MAILPPIAALKHLEPRPGGQWAITGQSEDAISLSYIMDGGADAIAYTMHQCTTEEEIQAHCSSLVYEFTGFETNNDVQSGANQNSTGSHNTQNRPLDLAIRPRGQAAEEESQIGQAAEIANLNFSFDTQPSIISPSEETNQGNLHFEVAPMVSESQVYQQTQAFSMGGGQQALPTDLTTNPIDWSMGNEFLPTNIGNTALPTHNSIIVPGIGNMQDSHVLSSVTWQENWNQMNELATHGASEGWDMMFSNM